MDAISLKVPLPAYLGVFLSASMCHWHVSWSFTDTLMAWSEQIIAVTDLSTQCNCMTCELTLRFKLNHHEASRHVSISNIILPVCPLLPHIQPFPKLVTMQYVGHHFINRSTAAFRSSAWVKHNFSNSNQARPAAKSTKHAILHSRDNQRAASISGTTVRSIIAQDGCTARYVHISRQRGDLEHWVRYQCITSWITKPASQYPYDVVLASTVSYSGRSYPNLVSAFFFFQAVCM